MPRKIITIITPHYSPEITAAAYRMEAVAKTLSSSFKVHVITLAETGSLAGNNSMKFDENLTVHYLSVRTYNKSVFFIRAFYEWWYSKKLLRKANTINADLAIVTIPFMFLLPVFSRHCKTKKKIADIRDLVWHYLPSTSVLKNIIRKKITSMMHRSLDKFDAITVTNKEEKEWLMNYAFFPETRIIVIPNGISREKFKQLSEIIYAPHPQKFTITYIGNLGSSQHFYSLIDAVKEMKDVRLNLVGDGNELQNLQSYLSTYRIQNVFIHGKLKWMRAVPYYQTSDLLYASLKENFDTAIPSKLYEYLSTGLPVLYQGSGAAVNMLGNFKNTFTFSGDDAKLLENLIWKIKRLSPERSEKNIQNIRKNFIREDLSIKFTELSARLLNEKALSDVFVEDILFSTKY